jgi:hypothetical protein
VNAYLAYDAGKQIPSASSNRRCPILGTGRLSGRAVVDLDAVRKQHNPTSLLDPMNYLSGRLPVSATGVLTTSKGWAVSAGVGVHQQHSGPKLLLQEIVSYYSKTAENPRASTSTISSRCQRRFAKSASSAAGHVVNSASPRRLRRPW